MLKEPRFPEEKRIFVIFFAVEKPLNFSVKGLQRSSLMGTLPCGKP